MLLGSFFRKKQSVITSQPASQTALSQRHALSVCFAATSPIGRGTGVPVRPTRDEQSLSYPETVVPCYRGQQLRDNIPCQAVVILDSGALPFSDRVSFARSAWASPARQCLSLWERWHRASDDGEGKPVSREPPCSDKLSLWESDAIAAPIPLRQHPCPLRRSAPALPKGEPKGILPDGFSPFTQETGRFAQVLLIFFPQMWYIQSNLIFYGLTIFFTVQRRFLYVVLS